MAERDKSGIQELFETELGEPLGEDWAQPESEAKQGDAHPRETWIRKPPRDLIGLALSGGGLRSATFNLGLLQGLHELKLLKGFDYLATVSGGSYIGGFWTAWRHWHGEKEEEEIFPPDTLKTAGREHEAIRHLREFSNFLIPNLGLLSVDMGRVQVALLCALIPSLLTTLSLVVVVLILWILVAHFLLGNAHGAPSSHVVMLGITLAWLAFTEWQRGRQLGKLPRLQKERDAEDGRSPWMKRGKLSVCIGIAGLLTLVSWSCWAGFDWAGLEWQGLARSAFTSTSCEVTGPGMSEWLLGKQISRESVPRCERWSEVLVAFMPSLVWGSAVVSIVVLRWLSSRWASAKRRRTFFFVLDRIGSRLLHLAAGWAALTALWVLGQWLKQQLFTPDEQRSLFNTGAFLGALVLLMGVFARVQRLLGVKVSEHPASHRRVRRMMPLLPQLLAYAILAMLVSGTFALICTIAKGDLQTGIIVAAIALGVSLASLFLFDPNRMGLHAFYKARIARAFLGGAHGNAPGETDTHKDDVLRLNELQLQGKPVHLICCTANDLGTSNPMSNLHRGARSAVLSPLGFSVGGEGGLWKARARHPCETKENDEGCTPTLASALTASGAAFNSLMGSLSVELGPAVTFLMSALNLRLGLWWPHPKQAEESRRSEHEGKKKCRKVRRWCVGVPFYKELFGYVSTQDKDVHLSDGGHFDNLALYELVRRHCRYIVVSDCSMDPDATFKDFGTVVRRVREDFGVEIEIDLSPLRHGPVGQARQPMVAGTIHYPRGEHGVLLLLKPTLVGTEPPDISQYQTRHSDFPHESTGDQFYDESQWESYRRLGEYVAHTAFAPLLELNPQSSSRLCSAVFEQALSDWRPLPAGYKERFAQFVESAASLDKELHEGGSIRKFFPELDAQSSPELASELVIARRALLLMEEVFLLEDFEKCVDHAAYAGVKRYFERWARTPFIRTWWSPLRNLYSRRFTRFMEDRFELPRECRADAAEMRCEEAGRLKEVHLCKVVP